MQFLICFSPFMCSQLAQLTPVVCEQEFGRDRELWKKDTETAVESFSSIEMHLQRTFYHVIMWNSSRAYTHMNFTLGNGITRSNSFSIYLSSSISIIYPLSCVVSFDWANQQRERKKNHSIRCVLLLCVCSPESIALFEYENSSSVLHIAYTHNSKLYKRRKR